MSHQEICGEVIQGICNKIQNKKHKKYIEKTKMNALKNYVELYSNRIPKDRHNERFKIKERLYKKLLKRKLDEKNDK